MDAQNGLGLPCSKIRTELSKARMRETLRVGRGCCDPQPCSPPIWHLAEPLLQTNRQVRQESLSLFYGLNSWFYQVALRNSETSSLAKIENIFRTLGANKIKEMKELRLIVFFEGGDKKAGILQWRIGGTTRRSIQSARQFR